MAVHRRLSLRRGVRVIAPLGRGQRLASSRRHRPRSSSGAASALADRVALVHRCRRPPRSPGAPVGPGMTIDARSPVVGKSSASFVCPSDGESHTRRARPARALEVDRQRASRPTGTREATRGRARPGSSAGGNKISRSAPVVLSSGRAVSDSVELGRMRSPIEHGTGPRTAHAAEATLTPRGQRLRRGPCLRGC